MTLKLAHIINPVVVKESSDLFIAQPITFQTMKIAQEFAQKYDVEVQLYSAQYPEDHSIIPKYFQKTPDLERSVLDIGDFKVKRKLPLIKDILDNLYEATDAEYLIYTNTDIALMPNFYVIVSQIINQGYDAFVINRRTISKQYSKLEEIPLMYAEAGEKHDGHDCFVFKKSIYKYYELESSFIGVPPIGKILLLNLIGHATKFNEFTELHLTFHLGNDGDWKSSSSEQLYSYNLNEFKSIYRIYQEKCSIPNHILVDQMYKKWIIHDLGKNFRFYHKSSAANQRKTMFDFRLFKKIKYKVKLLFL